MLPMAFGTLYNAFGIFPVMGDITMGVDLVTIFSQEGDRRGSKIIERSMAPEANIFAAGFVCGSVRPRLGGRRGGRGGRFPHYYRRLGGRRRWNRSYYRCGRTVPFRCHQHGNEHKNIKGPCLHRAFLAAKFFSLTKSGIILSADRPRAGRHKLNRPAPPILLATRAFPRPQESIPF